MSKYDLMKNVAKKNKQADSSKTVSNPTVKTTQSQTAKKTTTKKTTTQPSSSGYWQDEQQQTNKQATKQARQTMNLPKPKQTLSPSQKRSAQADARIQNNRKKEAEKKAKSYDPNTPQDYSQANAGIKAILSGKNAGSAMRNYANANKKLMEQRRYEQAGQAEAAQAYVDTARNKVNSNKLTKAISDTGLSALGGLTQGVGGLVKSGSNLVQGYAGLTGNQNLAKKVQRFDSELGVDEALRNVNDNNMVANNMVGKVAQSIGGMVPTIAGTLLSGGSNALGLGVMGASVFGNEGSQAFNNLSADGNLTAQDTARALTTGALKAGLEVGTEQLSSLFPGLDTFAFTNPNHLLGQAGGEALEEMVSSAFEPFIDPLANPNVKRSSTPDIHGRYGLDYGQEAYNNTFGNVGNYAKEIGESGLLGAATSLAMGAPANVQRITRDNAISNAITEGANEYQPMAEPPAEKPLIGSVPGAVDKGAVTVQEPMYQFTGTEEYTPAGNDTLQVANEKGEVFEEAPEDGGNFVDKTIAKIKSLFDRGTSSTVSDKSMDYILSHVRDAVTTGDPQALKTSAHEVLSEVAADTNIPQEIVDKITGGQEINQTAEKIAEGKPIGFAQEEVSDLTGEAYTQKVQDRADDITYSRTLLEPLESEAQRLNKEIGSLDNQYNDFMQKNPGTTIGDRVKRVFGNALGIQTDYDTVLHVAKGMDVKSQIEAEMNKITNEIEEKGYTVTPITSSNGDISYKVMQDGKIVDAPELKQQIKDLTELTAKNTAIEVKIANIGHNVALILRLFRTDTSPAGQLKQVNQHIERINKEMDRKFTRQIKNGELSHVQLDQNLVKQFLAESDPMARLELIRQMAEDVESQVPHSFMDKLDSFRYNNLLFNPLTWVRNSIGNFGQSQMSNVKDLTLYAIESYEKLRGRVRYNNLDMADANDRALMTYTAKATADMLYNDYAEAKATKNAKKYLKSLGYEGSLLNTLNHFKGKSFNFSEVDQGLSTRMDEVLANTAKEKGYTVKDGKFLDKNGQGIASKEYRQLLNEAFKKAKKQWLSANDLRMAKRNGTGKGTSGFANNSQRKIFWNEGFDILNPEHESVAGMQSDGIVPGDAFMSAYNEAHRRHVFSDKNPFGWTQNKISDAVDFMMNRMPGMGDNFWIRSNYSRNMVRMLDAQGYDAKINEGVIELYDADGNQVEQAKADAILDRLNKDAYQWALEDTYHDANEIANILNELERNGKLSKFLMNSIQPFIKTPLNIARRAIEYSPAGIITSLTQLNDVKAGRMSATTWLNNMSKGATGASAMLIGAWLASLGILRAKGDDKDEKITRFEESKGLQPYSIKIPGLDDWSATVDWMAPGIAPFLLGAGMQEVHEQYVPQSEDENAFERTMNLVGSDLQNAGLLFQPIADTTMLSGLMDTLSVFGNDKKDWMSELTATTVQNYIRQLSPVLGSKLMGIVDPTKYSTASNSFFDRQLRASAINIRILDYIMTAIQGEQYLQPQIDLNGKPIQTQDYGLGAAGRAITNLVNPATVKNDTRDATDLELERLYNVTGKDYLLPTITTAYKDKGGAYFKFTPKERTEFNEYYLPNYKKAATEFMNSLAYQDYDDAQRANILNSMANHFFTEAQAKYLGRVVPDADQLLTKRDKACDFVNGLGVSVPSFYGYINTAFDKDAEGNSINNTRAMKIRAQMEADGIWDNIVKAIKKGTFEPGDFNLNNAVTGWSTEDFTYYYNKMLDGRYDGTLRKNKKK